MYDDNKIEKLLNMSHNNQTVALSSLLNNFINIMTIKKLLPLDVIKNFGLREDEIWKKAIIMIIDNNNHLTVKTKNSHMVIDLNTFEILN